MLRHIASDSLGLCSCMIVTYLPMCIACKSDDNWEFPKLTQDVIVLCFTSNSSS